jgi:uncharacterized protein YyaL (SSP411 family)
MAAYAATQSFRQSSVRFETFSVLPSPTLHPRRAPSIFYSMPNRLSTETSPYLLQHVDNPVDWYPWGNEALARASAEDKPILLSIGYAACHWCHVMAHESFEDPATAAVMNEHFVNIKVDREERPDLDAIYMQAVQAMTGHGGWPMTVFLTPQGEPFYGGTYFPPADRHGMPSFTKLLRSVADAYRDRRDSIQRSADSVRTIYHSAEAATHHDGAVTAETLTLAYQGVATRYDTQFGGFEGAPKFPPTMILDFLLRHWARTGTREALTMAHHTFLAMAHGGIYDQIGGGFARYTVDGRWLVPHFEKMLYDNALLIRFGTHLWQATRDDEVRRVTEETVRWLSREMTSPAGGFFSSLDADSEGHEGKFYIWDESELIQLLGADAPVVRAYYGTSASGNFEGKNILHVPTGTDAVADRLNMRPDAVRAAVLRAKPLLYDVRAKRVWPGRDEKVLAGWNGLTLRGVAEAARVFERDDFSALALRNAEFLRDTMMQDGRVMRTHKDGVTRIPGFLEDHAAVALGFLALFEHTLDSQWLQHSRTLTESAMRWFWDADTRAFYDVAHDGERLITRPRDVTDNAIPSGTSLVVDLLFRMSNYTGDDRYRARGRDVLETLTTPLVKHPAAFGHMLGAAEYAETFACHGEYCDMPSPRALDIALEMSRGLDANTTL